jgi:hypothetical protein
LARHRAIPARTSPDDLGVSSFANGLRRVALVLREFLYVDTDKVRGMLAQLDGGIAEEERQTNKND